MSRIMRFMKLNKIKILIKNSLKVRIVSVMMTMMMMMMTTKILMTMASFFWN